MHSTHSGKPSPQNVKVAVVGGGPAGLMAAEILSGFGHEVHLFDAMPSVGRKFLLAGKGGLNLTHSESSDQFLNRYGEGQAHLAPILTQWAGHQARDWAHGLGIETFVGTSGRVFPKEMKAAPLLRAWLSRLRHPLLGYPVQFHMRHKLLGLKSLITQDQEGSASQTEMTFETRAVSSELIQVKKVTAQWVLLALGGGSWARLGSDGAWVPWLQRAGVPVNPLLPSNCGFHVAGRQGQGWTQFFSEKFAGHALKSVALCWHNAQGEELHRQGEFVVTVYGVEGSLIYTASADLRRALESLDQASLQLDLLPDKSLQQVVKEVAHPRGKRSLSTHLKSRLGLEGVKMGLLNELVTPEALQSPLELAKAIKGLDLKITATRPLDEAISSAGGVQWSGMDFSLQALALPGVFCAGEMLDWEAPTGGYLLTAAMATGRHAAKSLHALIKGDEP